MKKFLSGCLFLCALNLCYSQSATLDPAFGTRGIVKTDMGTSYNYNGFARQVLTQPGGAIYILLNGNFPGSVISKRLASGAIDSTYGINGYSGSVPVTEAFAALQPDGKIVIAGVAGNNSFVTERLKSNGTPDSSFGTYGIKVTEFNGASFARSVVIQSDGKIVVAGHTADNSKAYFAVVRYNPNGSNDNSFNGNGKALTDFMFKMLPDFDGSDSVEVHEAYAYSIGIQQDGKIVLGGYVNAGTRNDFAVARYNTNGTPDSTFDHDGKQNIDFGSDDYGYSLAIQTDGKILLGGYTFVESINQFAVARFNTNGSVDVLFDGDGKQTAVVGSDMQIGNSLAIQTTGKIVIAGYTLNGDYNDFAIARFNTDGSTDNGFGTDGVLTTDFTSSDDYAGSVALQADDKIVVAGYSYIYSSSTYQQIAVSRYNADGTPDNSFADNGKLAGDNKQGFTSYNYTAIQANGKVIAAGKTWNGSNYDFAIARYNVNGSLDKTFSADGKQTTDFGGTDEAISVVLQTDGKIIVAGSNDYKFAIARYNTDGSSDNTFNGNGKLVMQIGFADVFKSMALQKDGKIVLAGYTYTNTNYDSSFFAIARLNIDGTPDNTFSGDGKQLTDFNDAPSFASAVNIQNDGKIVVTGRSFINNQDNFAVARYNNNGSLDNSFSQDGKVTNVFGTDDYYAQSAAIQTDGKLVVVGYSQIPTGGVTLFTAARYETNGSLDNTFGTNGHLTINSGSGFFLGTSVAINSNGKIAVSGTNGNFTIGLFKTNGDLDSSFGINGILTTPVGLGSSSIQSIAFWNDKLYAVGAGQFPGSFGVVARYTFAEGGPLAVSLLDFKAILLNKAVALQWQIATEKDLSGFSIERSADGVSFLPFTYIISKGSSDAKANYSTVDKQPLSGVNFYRLKMYDKVGTFTYSKIVSVTLKNETFNFRVFPNPVQNVLFVNVNSENDNENGTFQIIDETGRKLKELVVSLNTTTAFSIYVNNLPKGIYNLQLQTKTKTETKRFIKE